MIPSSIFDLAIFCKEVGITEFIVSPGSRSAPIVLALNRIGGINLIPVFDERSAGFIALGKSLASQKSVGLVCTSGTAVLNYGPAIAEAFYQNVPLFVITADRPPELIDQNEGQAIRQDHVFKAHTKFSAIFPSLDETLESKIFARRILKQAWFEANQFPKGPIHINVPLREPLYPESEMEFDAQPFNFSLIENTRELDRYQVSSLIESWNQAGKKLIIVGNMPPDPDLRNALKALSEYGEVPVIGDIINNLIGFDGLIQHVDSFPKSFWSDENNTPDLIITLGNGLLSKALKNFIKTRNIKNHWHIQPAGFPADPYGTITKLIHANPEKVITRIGEGVFFQTGILKSVQSDYCKHWQETEKNTKRLVYQFLEESSWSDLKAVGLLMENIPENACLFLGNSMSIRYANWFPSKLKRENLIFSNRGTSGIDGCISTAVGIAVSKPEKQIICLVGDISFFYDRNGIWMDKVPSNLKIVVLNNGGGNIFRIIPGSSAMPELESYFEMDQVFSVERSALDSKMEYFCAGNTSEFSSLLKELLASPKPSIMECRTDKYQNTEIVKNLKHWINQENQQN